LSHDPLEIILNCCSRNVYYYQQCWEQLICVENMLYFLAWKFKRSIYLK